MERLRSTLAVLKGRLVLLVVLEIQTFANEDAANGIQMFVSNHWRIITGITRLCPAQRGPAIAIDQNHGAFFYV